MEAIKVLHAELHKAVAELIETGHGLVGNIQQPERDRAQQVEVVHKLSGLIYLQKVPDVLSQEGWRTLNAVSAVVLKQVRLARCPLYEPRVGQERGKEGSGLGMGGHSGELVQVCVLLPLTLAWVHRVGAYARRLWSAWRPMEMSPSTTSCCTTIRRTSSMLERSED